MPTTQTCITGHHSDVVALIDDTCGFTGAECQLRGSFVADVIEMFYDVTNTRLAMFQFGTQVIDLLASQGGDLTNLQLAQYRDALEARSCRSTPTTDASVIEGAFDKSLEVLQPPSSTRLKVLVFNFCAKDEIEVNADCDSDIEYVVMNILPQSDFDISCPQDDPDFGCSSDVPYWQVVCASEDDLVHPVPTLMQILRALYRDV